MQTESKSLKLTSQQISALMNYSPKLLHQSYQDISNLTLLSPSILSRQATLNIGTVGHVAHGKSTLVKTITSIDPGKFKEQKKRNCTIKLGYANAKIYKCLCERPGCYKAYPSQSGDLPDCEKCGGGLELIRHISFVDCPGHDKYLSTMLTGTTVMDATLLVVAADLECPQPQTKQHLMVLEIARLKNVIVLQNKLDMIYEKQDRARENYEQIRDFLKNTQYQKSPVIPISALFGYNIDAVLEEIVNIPIPTKNLQVPPVMSIVRSFDINRIGTEVENLVGGIVGGTLLQGVLAVGMEVEIRPGVLTQDANGKIRCMPLKSRVVEMFAGNNELLYAVPGGLIGVRLLVDPSFTKKNRLCGNFLGVSGSLPDIFSEIDVEFYLMRKSIGVKKLGNTKQEVKIDKLKEGEILLLNVGAKSTEATIRSVNEKIVKIRLDKFVCTNMGEKITLSRKMVNSWRLIGWGKVVDGKTVKV